MTVTHSFVRNYMRQIELSLVLYCAIACLTTAKFTVYWLRE